MVEMLNGNNTWQRLVEPEQRPSSTPPLVKRASKLEYVELCDSRCTSSLPVFYPSDTWRKWWDTIIMLLVLYSSVSVPIRLCFNAEAEGRMWSFEAAISIAFLTDLAINFNTAVHDENDWISDRAVIARQYLRGMFWIDAPSSVPVELLEVLLKREEEEGGGSSSSGNQAAAFRVLRMFRLVRLLRLLRVEHYVARIEEEVDVNLRALRVMWLVMKLLFLSHLLGCGWMATTNVAGIDESTWIREYNDGAAAEGPTSRQYLYAFYWALSTLVGHDCGVVPMSDVERQYDIFAALLSALVFGYVVGEIGTLLAALDRQGALVQERLDSVKEYLLWRKIPRTLSIRVRRYYE